MARHWVDELADRLDRVFRERGKRRLVFNGGLSVSGLQHIGRLRGEIILVDAVASVLRERGYVVEQYITLYTQDAWKGKRPQLEQFSDPGEAEKYRGWPLINVPDPHGCHSNWVEHYWSDFGPYIGEFTRGVVRQVTTTELYRGRMREFIHMVFQRRGEVRRVINKYRGRRPYPDTWIPFEPRCGRCGRIDSTEATLILDMDHVWYRCRSCGYEDAADISDGKLNWRIEWVGVWWSLGVDFEPYGKDHATPGGSRDSCNDLARNVFGLTPPEGVAYEWVGLKTSDGRRMDMGSSDFVGVTPREWLEVAHPEVLRFLYLKVPPMRKIYIGMHEIPLYYDQYYQAERIYYGAESIDPEEDVVLKRSYELSYTRGEPPPEMPEQVPYTHLAILVQIVPRELWFTEGLRRLQHIGLLPEKPSIYGLERIKELLPRARRWVEKYAPERLRVEIRGEPDPGVIEAIPAEYRERLLELARRLEALGEWSSEAIKQAMIEATRDMGAAERRLFYKYFYLLVTGREYGPRAAPLLAILGREKTLRLLRGLEAAEK